MKSKILLPILGLAIIGGTILYNPKVFSNVKPGKMTVSLLDDNPNSSNNKVINPFPKEMEIETKQLIYEQTKTSHTIREILNKNQISVLFPNKEIPTDFSCKELSYEVDIHNQNANAPRYDMSYQTQVNAEVLANSLSTYENPFVFTQLYHRNNIKLSTPKGKYLYNEHFPENQPEEQAYLVRKVSHLLPLFNEDNQIKYLHFSVYARHVERGVYETYQNYVIKYNNDGTMNHFIAFSKNSFSWVKLNYDASSKLTYIDNINLNQYSEKSTGKNNITCQYIKLDVREKS